MKLLREAPFKYDTALANLSKNLGKNMDALMAIVENTVKVTNPQLHFFPITNAAERTQRATTRTEAKNTRTETTNARIKQFGE